MNIKPLKDYSEEELDSILQKNEFTKDSVLGRICSEILKRQRSKNNGQILQNSLNKARSVCDPIEFQKRQQDLLYSIAEFLLLKEGFTQEI